MRSHGSSLATIKHAKKIAYPMSGRKGTLLDR